MRQIRYWSIAVVLLLGAITQGECNSALSVRDERCEYIVKPLGVDIVHPRLSWQLESAVRGDRQSAYQILAADNINLGYAKRANLWNSGKVISSNSLNILYNGKPLHSNQQIYWNVRVWDRDGNASVMPGRSSFTTGLIASRDWHGKWIRHPRNAISTEAEYYGERPAPLLRKEFVIHKSIRRAIAFAAGLGYYELHLNGNKVGDHKLGTAWTAFSKRVLYSTFDVTHLLHKGSNAVGFVLGNGWYNPLPLRLWGHLNLREFLTIGEPRALLELRIEYQDGTKQRVVTDPSWRAGDSPILKNSIYLGETFDARREQPGWDNSCFDDANWQQAVVSNEPVGAMRAEMIPPVRVTRKVSLKSVNEIRSGIFIFDMGQNFAGTVTLKVQGAAGTKVVLRYGELLNSDGTLNVKTSCAGQIKNAHGNGGPGAPDTAEQSDTYYLRDSGQEVFTPRFTWHGFRYVEVTGFPGRPTLKNIIGNRMNTDVSQYGMEFVCSNNMLNRIHQITEWTFLSNLFSVQSDCPHRERFGYGGDIAATSEMAMLHFDMSTFYSKAVIDLEDAVRPNGGFTETAPYVGIADSGLGGGAGPIGWGAAHNLLLWQLYQYYGNVQMVAAGYPFAKRYVDLLEKTAKDDILNQDISDHESLDVKPVELTATAFYYQNVRLLEKMAAILHKKEDATHYQQMAARIFRAFQIRFNKGGTAEYDTGTQACQAIALAFDMVPKNERKAALNALVSAIHKQGDHLSTGIFGTKYMLTVLSENGYADLAYKIVNQKSFPGWGYMLKNGATTLWEHWEGSDDTFSQNHPMFGSVDEWLTKSLGGIAPAADAVGFDHVIIRPQIVGDLKSAASHYASVHGVIVSEWKISGKHLKMIVSMPVGCRADVTIPAGWDALIREGNRPVSKSAGVSSAGNDSRGTHLNVRCGRYVFESVKPSSPPLPKLRERER